MKLENLEFNINYNNKTKRYEIIIYNGNEIRFYKSYEVNYIGQISQTIIDDIKDLSKLGYSLNIELSKTISQK